MSEDYAEKLDTLADIEGFDDFNEMIEDFQDESLVPGICMNEDCEYSVEVEKDESAGFCEECETDTVKSCLILAKLV